MNFYSEHKLSKESRFVNKIWCLDNSNQETSIENMKILPNGCFNIGLLIGNGALLELKNKSYNFEQGIYLCSQVTQPANLTLLGQSKVILIQIQAWYFSYYSENDLSSFVDDISKSESASQLFNQNIDLNSTSILQDTLDISEKHFLDFATKHPEQNIIEQIIREILLNTGNVKISDILQKFPYSERWIQVRFKQATGLTAKQFSKIIQFRDSVDKIAYDSAKDSLTSIGYDAGFTDQSHFIKNFRQFTGITPSRFNPKNFVLSYPK